MLNQFKTSLDRSLNESSDWKSLRNDWCEGSFPIVASGASSSWGAAILAKLLTFTGGSILVITPDELAAESLFRDVKYFTEQVSFFPWWGTMLYKGVSPRASVFGKRATVLAEMIRGEKRIIVSSLRAALGYVPPPSVIGNALLHMEKGRQFNPTEIEMRLIAFGYNRVSQVSVPGEFALRGEVLDVHPWGIENAFRVVFEWDTIEEIRSFDPLSQSSLGELDYLVLHPLKEMLWDDNSIEKLKRHISEEESAEILESLESTGSFRGEELFYPLVTDSTLSIQDYLSEKSVSAFMEFDKLSMAAELMADEYTKLYEQAKERNSFVPEPHFLHQKFETLYNNRKRRIEFHNFKDTASSYKFYSEPSRSFFGNISYMKEELSTLLQNGYQIFVFAESESQSQRIAYLLQDLEGLIVSPATLSEGFSLPDSKIMVIQENEIFGRRKKSLSSLKKVRTEVIETFVDLNPGDFVVHINYGIGLFMGIKRIQTMRTERDYIELQYAEEETVFIPIEQVNLIQRYIGQEGRAPRLDRMGGSSWERKKQRAKRSVEILAEHLIKLYARRQMTLGYAFPKDNDFQISFEAAFPWQETPDQLKAIDDVKTDMEHPTPMDRLVCGDVGYGKTEIAMRASFKAVMGGRQVAILCPTTILAEQHHESFMERFKRFPVNIAMLSRFISTHERKNIITDVEKGKIDIVIGTHRILSKDVIFKQLGLMVIDEEQRFGVKHKERLKELKASVDCLTLSATPIPRTLHMSLLKIRDMSLLRTAPNNRQPIETFIQKFNPELVANAIRQEVERGGQVFFLHNRVKTLEETQIFLRSLVPEVFIEVAHGQMSSRELEDIMHRFVHGAFQVLISTTIIENGIDIPNVNTIIIDRADMYGISQLYQLRGRVGRSGRLAYAYLMYPEHENLSELAMKRLQVISDFTELGSGFKIAMKDMEVRGAGNLLGSQQTGSVYTIGFELYLKFLEEAIQERSKDETDENICETYLELDYSGFIPDAYISDESAKMEIYKKIASVSDEEDLQHLHQELHDRYGSLPDEVYSLMSIAEIRIICSKLRVASLKETRGLVHVKFSKVSLISVDKVMKMMGSSGGKIKLNPVNPDTLIFDTGKIGLKEKSTFIRERLEALL